MAVEVSVELIVWFTVAFATLVPSLRGRGCHRGDGLVVVVHLEVALVLAAAGDAIDGLRCP